MKKKQEAKITTYTWSPDLCRGRSSGQVRMDRVTKLRPVPLRMGSAGGKTAFEILKRHLGANGASGYLPLDS